MFNIDAREGKPFTRVLAIFFTYLFLLICLFFVLFPLYWMINISFMTVEGYNAGSNMFFSDDILNGVLNYVDVFESYSTARSLLFTIIFSLITTLFAVVVTILTAFAFARFKFKGKKVVAVFFVFASIIPSEVLAIGNYSSMNSLGLTSTFIGLVFPSIINLAYIFVIYKSFSSVDDNLYYASKIDGLSDFEYLKNVLIPMFRPMIIAIIVMKLIECWNLYIWPTIVVKSDNYSLISTTIQS